MNVVRLAGRSALSSSQNVVPLSAFGWLNCVGLQPEQSPRPLRISIGFCSTFKELNNALFVTPPLFGRDNDNANLKMKRTSGIPNTNLSL